MPREKTRIFLDASVFIAASKSQSGGSALVLEVCQSRRFQAISSRAALWEARQNIKWKFSDNELVNFYRQVANLDLEMAEPATEEENTQYAQIIDKKDAHVLASAIKWHADILVTLDRKHFKTESIERARLPLIIMTPGEFLERLSIEE